MIGAHRLALSLGVLFIARQLAGTEVEVVFEGEVILTELPGSTRGQPVSGRILYDNTAAVGLEGANFREYPAVSSFEIRVGDTGYAMSGGSGTLLLVDDGFPTKYVVFRTEPAGLLGPPTLGFSPLSLNLALLASSPALIPSLDLGSVATNYSLENIANELGESGMGIQFQSGGDVVTGASIALRSLDARPYLPPFPLGRAIRLEDIVAGGDGSHNAPPANVGIDPRTGAFTTTYFAGHITDTDGVNPQPVPDSPYIDSVFLLKGRVPTAQDGCNGCFVQYTTQSGVKLLVDDSEETNTGFNYILKNRIGGISEEGIRVSGFNHFTSSIGLHASAGITFDLDALRARHGEEAVGCFSTFWGMDDCGSGLVRLYVMVSNDIEGVTDIRNAVYGPGQGEHVSMTIPSTARYLTLASASVDGNMNCDHATIARPIITPLPCQTGVLGWIWGMEPSRVAPGGEKVLIEGEALDPAFSIRVGGVDLPDQVILGNGLRTARIPPLNPGIYDAEIIWDFFGPNLIDRFPGAIEVVAPPVITGVSPDQVLIDRPILCRFMGQNLRPDMEVYIPNADQGASRLLHQEFHSPELITGYIPRPVSPQQPIAGTDVVYIRDQGRFREFPVGLLYVEIGVEKVVPDIVSTAGGTVVTVEGLGFEPGMTFRIDSSPLLDIEVIDSAHARGRTPPLTAGLHSVSMVLGDGHVQRTVPGLIQALPSQSPQITSVVPLTISTRGGDLVSVFTDTWHGGATPRVGGLSLSNVDASQPNLLRGETPQLGPGLYDVDLVGADGAVITSFKGGIVAVEPPGIAITSVSPSEVSVNGGTPVTFIGTGFEPGLEPRLGGQPLTQVEFVRGVDGEQFRGLSPPLAEGPHFASLTEGDAERARLPDAVHALPIQLPAPPVLGRPPAPRFAAGNDRIAIPAAGVPSAAVLRVGGVPVLAVAPSSPCGLIGGEGGGGGIAAGGGHAVFEGIVPPLAPGNYSVDFYVPGQGILATLDEAVEVVAATAAPVASQVVSADVLADGSTRLHIFGSCFAPGTRFALGGKPIADAVVVSSHLAIGHAPELGAGEPLGPRTLEVSDPRGTSSLASAVIYVEPKSAPGVAFVRGDANQSGAVDISDALSILGYLFLGSPLRLDCLEAGDIDGGGEVNITDPIQLLGHLFLGGNQPRAPYPDCGVGSGASELGCDGFEACGQGGGVIDGLRPNVFVLPETRTTPGEPILRDLSPVSHEVVIDDPPGGLDLEPGDIISGYVPVSSAAIHEGVTYLVKLEGERPRSCLATAPGDRTYLASPAALPEVFNDAAIEFEMPNSAVDMRLSSGLVTQTGSGLCDMVKQAGGAGGGLTDRSGEGGGFFTPLIDVELPPIEIITWNDGPNYIHAGFHRLRVLYANDQASLGVGTSGLKVTGVSFFSGVLLDTEMVVYVDAHYEDHIRREKKVLSLRKDHIVVVYGVPIHFAATGDLFAGVEIDAEANLNAVAGAKAHFKMGAGIRYDGRRIENLSGIDPPTLAEIPNTTELNLSGSLAVKGYVRPETHLFAGILFRGLTADIGMRGEAFARFHAAGTTQPVPCFDWGIDAGMQLTMVPEIQFFGKDLFDETIGVIDEEALDLVGGRYGCKKPPVARVSYYLVPLPGGRYEAHLDASASYDPDGGPLRFRWDFNADGQCDRASLGDPRTTVEVEYDCPPFQLGPGQSALCRRSMRLRVTDDENVAVDHDFKVVLR